MSDISITLQSDIKTTVKGTVSLKYTAEAFGCSPKVFAVEALPKSADQKAPQYRFSHVCSPSELVEFPEDEPLDSPYFRTDSIEMLFDTTRMALSVDAVMRQDIRRLAEQLRELDDAEPETVRETF